ncbi:MAG: hypothetical protein ABI307_01475 [Mycobacterium sp.]
MTMYPQQARPAALRLWDQWAVFKPFALAGSLSVIAGGVLAAAIAAPSPTRHGVWAIAYLVLVLGVGQLVLGAGQALLAAAPPTPRGAAVTAAAFNTAGIAILAGIVTDHHVVFDVGSALLLVALVLFWYGVRHGARRSLALHAYRAGIAVLVVSIPIGAFLTTLGAH